MKSRYSSDTPIDDFTTGLVDLAVEIAIAAKEYNKDYFFGGGLAIDLFVGQITRNHHDIDFHPMLTDLSWWKNWFVESGYKIEKPASDDYPETCRILDKENVMYVDVWPFRLSEDTLEINYKGSYVDANRHWAEIKTVKFRMTDIRVENPDRILDQKRRHYEKGQEFREQDIHDYKLLRKSVDFIK